MKNFSQLKPFIKKSKKGFNGYPTASMAFYGPTNHMATKLVVGISYSEESEPMLFKWFNEAFDIRSHARILGEVTKLFASHKIKSITLMEKIFGCPHEEGIDYPEETQCPQCTYWQNRDRFTHLKIDNPANKSVILAHLAASMHQGND
ncbi:hypothetical protein [Legionella shakespearei]|uniref:Uncharacterized protein n=1 Tax=Legionella shakespearei DSM 23087 TaxID=1122169 RepID=A0A0W0Z0G1_9GAMM|nr:hypothetical protein [Legionella shakespearei]KTD62398.1 hypothetical protein Lsha_1098 [Legionella shakespearei DSM 23087]